MLEEVPAGTLGSDVSALDLSNGRPPRTFEEVKLKFVELAAKSGFFR